MPGLSRVVVGGLEDALDEESRRGQRFGVILQRTVVAVERHRQPVPFDAVDVAAGGEPRPTDDEGPGQVAVLTDESPGGVHGMHSGKHQVPPRLQDPSDLGDSCFHVIDVLQ